MKKPEIRSIHFIKAICALGIITFHFACQMQNVDTAILRLFANGSWGSTLVTTFFVVSGSLMHYHYGGELELKRYYYKRWRGLFPMFYIGYFYFMVEKVIDNRGIFYNGSPLSYLWTLLGLDGYVADRLTTYYIIGEWFLGAIIILYLLYPLVLRCFRKNHLLTFGVVLAVYALFHDRPITSGHGFWSISSCLVSFTFGMVFNLHRKTLTSRPAVLAAAAGVVLLYAVPLPISENVGDHLMGILLFLVLTAAGEVLMRQPVLYRMFREVSRISFAIFLVHHRILMKVAGSWQPGSLVKALVILLFAIFLILPAAKALTVVTDAVLKWADALAKSKRTAV